MPNTILRVRDICKVPASQSLHSWGSRKCMCLCVHTYRHIYTHTYTHNLGRVPNKVWEEAMQTSRERAFQAKWPPSPRGRRVLTVLEEKQGASVTKASWPAGEVGDGIKELGGARLLSTSRQRKGLGFIPGEMGRHWMVLTGGRPDLISFSNR